MTSQVRLSIQLDPESYLHDIVHSTEQLPTESLPHSATYRFKTVMLSLKHLLLFLLHQSHIGADFTTALQMK